MNKKQLIFGTLLLILFFPAFIAGFLWNIVVHYFRAGMEINELCYDELCKKLED